MFIDFSIQKDKRKKWGDVFAAVGGGVCATMAAEILLTIACVVILTFVKQEVTMETPVLLSLFCTFGGILGTAWVLKGQKTASKDVGVVINGRTIKEYFFGALLGLVMLVLSVLPAVVFGAAHFTVGTISGTVLGTWALYGVGFIIQSFSEEYLCRGLIMKRLSERYNIWINLVIQAVIFMLLHSGNPGMGIIPYINLFLMGYIFGQVVIITDNLMFASGLHWLWNFAQGCIFGIKVSGLEGMTTILECEMNGHHLLTGADFGIEGALTTTFVTLIVIIALTPKMFTIIKAKSLSVESAATTDENISTQEDTPC